MNLCRYQKSDNTIHIGLTYNGKTIIDLTAAGVGRLDALLEEDDLIRKIAYYNIQGLPEIDLGDIELLNPFERQEVWAAGVTYSRSQSARIVESDFSALAYNYIYDAERPHIFFKSLAEKVVPTGHPVGIRKDSKWSVPEPELVLVINSRGNIVGYTIGNDLSSRDIEGKNPLYLSQAKIYNRSCSIGPWIRIGSSEEEARRWTLRVRIKRNGEKIFHDEISIAEIERPFSQLVEYLFRSQIFPNGVGLLTGTGIVPPDDFALEEDDEIFIHVSSIGTLENQVVLV